MKNLSPDQAIKQFQELLTSQLARIEKVKQSQERIDYGELDTIIIGVVGGDGIGPTITKVAEEALAILLADDVASGRIKFVTIDGLTIERRIEVMQAIPDDVLEEIKKCHVILKGPTTTPERGDGMPNIESANVSMRKNLDLFANVRPIKVAELDIDWVFFRENTEDLYALGSQGMQVNNDMGIDFRVISKPGTERIVRAAFEYAVANGRTKVSVITKANVVKTSDGIFLETANEIAREYPGIEVDAWYIDIMTANLIDKKRQSQFQVMVLPNLYGDILTDEAGQIQGGVGTAGAANIGNRYAMFEAIHGSAPRMIKENRAMHADPSSMLSAAAMLLSHIGYGKLARQLEMALDVCGTYERKIKITGYPTGATGSDYAKYILDTMKDAKLEERWNKFQTA